MLELTPLKHSMTIPQATKLNVFIDCDGPLADYDKGLQNSGMHTDDFKYLPGTYLWLDVTVGAEAALFTLKELDDKNIIKIWIATKTPSGSPYAYSEKALWVRQKFPWLEDRIILTHDKSLLGSSEDILIDDRPHKANADKFKGTFKFFDVNRPKECWFEVLLLINEKLQ